MKNKATLLLFIPLLTGCFSSEYNKNTYFNDELSLEEIEKAKDILLDLKEVSAITIKNDKYYYHQAFGFDTTILSLKENENYYKYINKDDKTSHYQIINEEMILLDSYEESYSNFYESINAPIECYKSIVNSVKSGRIMIPDRERSFDKEKHTMSSLFLALEEEMNISIPLYDKNILVQSIKTFGVKSAETGIRLSFDGIIEGEMSSFFLQGWFYEHKKAI